MGRVERVAGYHLRFVVTVNDVTSLSEFHSPSLEKNRGNYVLVLGVSSLVKS